ncbi:MAG TPA: type II secretion system F family protein [Gemmatimonadaceae bacterium]|nr:type II secretion system F family protein [Gemmatimonadaceae bacterium]
MSFTVLGALRDLDEDRHRAELYRAWGIGLGAGLTNQFSLEQIGRIGFPRVEEARRYLLVGLQQQRAIGPLVKARPNLFDPFDAAILAAADDTQRLSTLLGLLADYYAREYRRKLKVRGFMGYLVFLGMVGAFSLTIPFLHRGGAQAYVKAVVAAITGFLLLGGILVSIAAAIIARRHVYALPRFARALAVGFAAGIQRGRVVQLAVDVSGSAELKRHTAKRSERELSLVPMAVLFQECRAVPAELLGQMSVADASGEYAAVFERYALGLEDKK